MRAMRVWRLCCELEDFFGELASFADSWGIEVCNTMCSFGWDKSNHKVPQCPEKLGCLTAGEVTVWLVGSCWKKGPLCSALPSCSALGRFWKWRSGGVVRRRSHEGMGGKPFGTRCSVVFSGVWSNQFSGKLGCRLPGCNGKFRSLGPNVSILSLFFFLHIFSCWIWIPEELPAVHHWGPTKVSWPLCRTVLDQRCPWRICRECSSLLHES